VDIILNLIVKILMAKGNQVLPRSKNDSVGIHISLKVIVSYV